MLDAKSIKGKRISPNDVRVGVLKALSEISTIATTGVKSIDGQLSAAHRELTRAHEMIVAENRR